MKTHEQAAARPPLLLQQLSQLLADTVEAVGPGIVRVEGRRRGASGIVWSAEGLVLTAHHNLQRDQELRIGLPDGDVVPARLIGRDPTTDLAVLQAAGAGLQPPAWAEAGDLRVGHLVLSVGRPGARVQAGLGIVSAVDGAWGTPGGGRLESYLQTDVALYPGFSGSALVSAAGRVVGMNTAGLLRGLSMALPAAALRRLVSTLTEHGRIRRGFLGVGAYPAQLPEEAVAALGRDTGLLILSVEPESPAARAALLVGDLIVALGDAPVRHIQDLLALLTGDRIGATVPLRVVRGGSLRDLPVTVGEQT